MQWHPRRQPVQRRIDEALRIRLHGLEGLGGGEDAYGLGTAAAALAAASRAAADVPAAALPPPPDDDLAVLADFCPAGRPLGMVAICG